MRIFGLTIIRTSKLDAIFDKITTFALKTVRQQKTFSMTITGTITAVLPETGGTSKSGKAWRKREAIVEYQRGQYPKSIVFQMMNDTIDKLNLQQGREYDLEIDFEAREWNGRHFLQASCWKATPAQPVVSPQPPAPPAQQNWQAAYPQPQSAPQSADDSLPF